MTSMIGRSAPGGPGGRDCRCCGQPPGRQRKLAKRSRKRAERTVWKRRVRDAQ